MVTIEKETGNATPLKRDVYPVLLAGGTGSRLWPVSRERYPKQLVKFIGRDSLVDVKTWAIATISILFLFRYKVNPIWILLGAGITGLLS